jgi:predicted nucleic acid-binding protein
MSDPAATPLVFVDTNVLIYAEDGAHRAKQATALGWLDVLWQRRCGRVSTQVLNEFYVNVTRKLRPAMPMGDARAEVRRYQHWQPWQVDQQTVETAWAFEARFGLSYWDALMVAAASHQGCQLLLTEDLQHGQVIDSLRIVNPFLQGPELLDAPA